MSVSTNKLSRFFAEHSCPSWLLDSVTRILPLNFLFLIFNWFFVSHQCAFGYSAYVLRSFSCNLHPTLSLILPYYMVIVLSYLPLVISSVLLTLYFIIVAPSLTSSSLLLLPSCGRKNPIHEVFQVHVQIPLPDISGVLCLFHPYYSVSSCWLWWFHPVVYAFPDVSNLDSLILVCCNFDPLFPHFLCLPNNSA